MLRKALLVIIAACIVSHAQPQADISGTITNQAGAAIEGASVFLIGQDISTKSDAAGHYQLTGALSALQKDMVVEPYKLYISNGILSFSLEKRSNVIIEIFDISGRLIKSIADGRLRPGLHSFTLGLAGQAVGMYFVRADFGRQRVVIRHIPIEGQHPALEAASLSASTLKKIAAFCDYLQASKSGYAPKQVGIEQYTGIVNIVLDTVGSIGSNPFDDGSGERLAQFGETQYFYGDMGSGDVPLVRITHSAVGDLVDIEVAFNPYFVDNTYGANAVGWNNHTFAHLVGSDHVQVAFVNGDGDTVLECKIDLLSATADAPSGYASLGPFGGDGEILSGDPSNILSWGTSLDDNLNYYGYNGQEIIGSNASSPATDSIYTPNPDYPNWQYYAVYRLTLDAAAFGTSGYGEVHMTSVHASPCKTGPDTVPVHEAPGPTPGMTDDPWRYYIPPSTTPSDTSDTTDVPY